MSALNYLTIPEVARHLRVSEDSVRRYIRRGQLKAYKVGGRVRVRPEDVEDFVEPVDQGGSAESHETGLEIIRDENLDALFAQLDELQDKYAGRWIAIADGRVAASAEEVPGLLRLIEELDLHEPLITQIPPEPVTWDLLLGVE